MPDWVYFHSMADIRDYLNWRGDLSFDISPLNEVDGLLLSYFSYLDMDECFRDNQGTFSDEESEEPSARSKRFVSFHDAVEAFFRTHTEKEIKECRPPFDMVPYVARQAASTLRYGSLMISDYVNLIDPEAVEQMAAMVFWIDRDTAFASFRGTDNTIAGWKEDFSLSYLRETPGQRHAVEFLDRVFGDPDDPARIYVGGHSKGGNLAVYSAAYAEETVRDRIISVYANDSPGFRQEIVEGREYRTLLPKIISILPESSIIGGLLSTAGENIVIGSTGTGLMQHNPISWEVMGTHFVRGIRSDLGRFFDDSMRSWLGGLEDREMQEFTDALFSILSAGGAKTLKELRTSPLKAINEGMQAAMNLSPEKKREFNAVILRLLKSGIDTLKDQSGEKYTALKERGEEKVTALRQDYQAALKGFGEDKYLELKPGPTHGTSRSEMSGSGKKKKKK